ncbi:hypothetical protein GCM10010387_42330 [Streptomyces inusitatus]|uniref:Uncharacterized protein n=1 Tax=Streptomyces inusitatus TaxID=68221 RepID=A0A918QFB2_9ACTN|nr:hypothetical protein GCM10010387_42330 [Streptomyces inusitatus]
MAEDSGRVTIAARTAATAASRLLILRIAFLPEGRVGVEERVRTLRLSISPCREQVNTLQCGWYGAVNAAGGV